VRSPDGGDSGAAPAPRAAALVRNVALVGHTAAGKTTLAEALLVRAGALTRAGRVEDGTATCDPDPVEQRLGHSVSLAVASLEWAGVKVNLLDTPGSPDFVGELRAGLRAADGVLFVVSAVGGLDAVTAQLWQECARVGVPRAVVITQLDRPRADFDETVALCQRVLDEGVLPVHLPMHDDDDSVAGLISLLDETVADSSSGTRVERPADPEHVKLIASLRSELIEAVIGESEDETLLDRYLDGEVLDPDLLHTDLHTAVARGHLHPALGASALAGVGLDELLAFLTAAFPSPLEHPLPPVTSPDGSPVLPATCDPDGPLLAEVVKTTTDAHLGRISFVRVFSGTLRPDSAVHVCGHGAGGPWQREDHPDHDVDARVGPLASPLGSVLRPVPSCPAGDICAVTRDTLSDTAAPLLVGPWPLPEPQLPIAVEAASRSEQERLASALARVVTEDPTVRLERRADTGQQLLWTIGAGHAEVVLDRLRSRSGVAVLTPDVQVAHRETLGGPARATGRHVKQSGGHGQYAVVELEVEPAPPGSGVVFEQRVVGGAVPTAFHGSVEKGVRAQAEQGVSPVGPLVDVKVVLVGGKAHAVDSSDAAFQTAGGLALREAAAAAGTVRLEPWCEVEVHVPSAYVGSAMSDLSGRRARVTSSEPDAEDDELTVVRAALPEVELLAYAAALRKVSHGTGSFTRRQLGYEPAPA
jgi:elongation factor G